MTTNDKQLPGTLGAHLLATYYRTLDDVLALLPEPHDRRLEEMGDVLPRPRAQFRPVREQASAR